MNAHPPTPTLVPYTTLFRSPQFLEGLPALGADRRRSLGDDGPRAHIQPPPGGLRCAQTYHPAPFGGEVSLAGVECGRSEEHTSELQSRRDLVCRLVLDKNKH